MPLLIFVIITRNPLGWFCGVTVCGVPQLQGASFSLQSEPARDKTRAASALSRRLSLLNLRGDFSQVPPTDIHSSTGECEVEYAPYLP